MYLLAHFLIMGIAILLAAYITPGVVVGGFGVALIVAFMLAIVNTFIRPILVILTLPINILTLGLFTLVINGLMVLLVSSLVPGFRVSGLGWAIVFVFILSIVSSLLFSFFGSSS
jgi:putative membrane protein